MQLRATVSRFVPSSASILVLLAACGSDPNISVDAGPDAAICTAPALAVGVSYELHWECINNCVTDAPFIYLDVALIGADELVFARDECPDCVSLSSAATLANGCIEGAGLPLTDSNGGAMSPPFSACPAACGLEAEVTFDGPAGTSTWLMGMQ